MSEQMEYLEQDEWRRVAATFDDYSYRQVWEFAAACAQRQGAAVEHVMVRDGGVPAALAHVRIKRVPLLAAGIAYINGGPLVRRDDGCSAARLRLGLRVLLSEYAGRRGLLLRVRPALGPPEWNRLQDDIFREAGFAPATRAAADRTILVDLTPPLEQIRRRMEQKWRNGLNRAERNGLTIRSGCDDLLFAQFCALYRQLRQRKTFDVDLPAEFYGALQPRLVGRERFQVSLAEAAGEPVAGHVAGLLGDTCVYLLGAGNEQAMQTKASYRLQWHAIQEARRSGCRWYDLGGIDPQANPGVYHFKRGLGGMDVTGAGPFEASRHPLRRHIVRACERMYRRVRGRSLTI